MRKGEVRQQGTGAQQESGARKASRGKLRALIGVSALALALCASAAPAASAEGEATMHVEFACNHVTFFFENFPEAEKNTVFEAVFIDGKRVVTAHKFVFNGPTGSNTVTIHVPPGHHKIDARARWETNGVKGGKDISKFGGITCDPEPSYKIEKDQKREGTKGYTQEELHNLKAGQTILYAIEVENTGNVPLKLETPVDPNCEEITGGASEIGIGQEAIFFCHHKLTAADVSAGEYCNIATETASPPEGQGAPITQQSNEVCAETIHKAGFTQEFSCKQVTFKFFNFPNLPNNTVHEAIFADGVQIYKGEFKFNGPSGENTVVINLPPGKHKNIDVRARWKTNGIEGQEDHKIGEVTCVAEPAFSIEKLQRIENESNYTTNELGAVVGQTVEYKIVVKNTGNTSIKFSELSDAKCEGISPSGEVEVGSGGEQVYTCSHVLLSAGKYGNTATITGAEETKTSNEVVVEVTF